MTDDTDFQSGYFIASMDIYSILQRYKGWELSPKTIEKIMEELVEHG